MPSAGIPGRTAKVAATWLLVAGVAATSGSTFTKALPEAVPSVEGWERISGEAEFERPSFSVEYEFYVNPKRYGLYEVVRYRIRYRDPRGDSGYSDNEKLQWDVGNKKLRRYECRPTTGAGGPCDWREMSPGTPEYDREVPVLLWLYGLHRSLIEEREAGRLPGH